jgi:hypothetical protein
MSEAFLLPDRGGNLSAVTVIKVTCSFYVDGSTRVAKNQVPLTYGDEYFGDPGSSSVRYASDMVAEKIGTDIVVNGQAYAPKGLPAKKVPVSLSVGAFRKNLVVWGDRVWTSTLGFVMKSSPVPFVSMPIHYERAFGGMDRSGKTGRNRQTLCRENPVGKGYRAGLGKKEAVGVPLPNIETPEHPIRTWNDRPVPAGFGFVSKTWFPRHSYSGTYSDAWRRERMPLPPLDADIRYANAAPPDMITKKPLSGRESVVLKNLHPILRTIRFTLPGLMLRTSYVFDNRIVKPVPVLDTLILEPDNERFILVFRSRYSGDLPWNQLKQVRIHEE